MNFKGTIVVTDPCYMKGVECPMQRGTIYGDWSCMVYPGNINENKKHEEWDEHYPVVHDRQASSLTSRRIT